MTRIKELTFEEQSTWGVCSVCGAKDGERCDPDVGFMMGMFGSDRIPPGRGVHLARLRAAPQKVEIKPYKE